MNDNHIQHPRARLFPINLPGLPRHPNPCYCGSHDAFVDGETDEETGKLSFFVWCVRCGAEGPRMVTHDLATAAWNQATQVLQSIE